MCVFDHLTGALVWTLLTAAAERDPFSKLQPVSAACSGTLISAGPGD